MPTPVSAAHPAAPRPGAPCTATGLSTMERGPRGPGTSPGLRKLPVGTPPLILVEGSHFKYDTGPWKVECNSCTEPKSRLFSLNYIEIEFVQ